MKYPRLLIDARQLLYRALWRVCKQGDPYGAPEAFEDLLEAVTALHAYGPEIVTLCWEGGHAHRTRLYAGYKSGRKARKPDEVAVHLAEQEARTKHAMYLRGWDQVWADGFEADDVMATIADRACGPVGIVTRDQDLYQVVSSRVQVVSLAASGQQTTVIGPEDVRAKYGVAPERLTSWKALVGDKSDSIPGVAGLGKRAATRLIGTHGSLDRVLALAPTIEAFQGVEDGTPWKSRAYAKALSDPEKRLQAQLSWALSTLVYCRVRPLQASDF